MRILPSKKKNDKRPSHHTKTKIPQILMTNDNYSIKNNN